MALDVSQMHFFEDLAQWKVKRDIGIEVVAYAVNQRMRHVGLRVQLAEEIEASQKLVLAFETLVNGHNRP